jgi:hypothetical protein
LCELEKTLLEKGEVKKQSNNNDSDKIMGLSEEKRFTSGYVIDVVVSFVFSELGFVYFHPFVLFTHSLWQWKCEGERRR